MKDDVQEATKGVTDLQRAVEGKESNLAIILSCLENTGLDSRDIIAWLSSLNFATKQNDFYSRRQEGTCEWLLEDDAFKSWLAGTESTLWCPGQRKSAQS